MLRLRTDSKKIFLFPICKILNLKTIIVHKPSAAVDFFLEKAISNIHGNTKIWEIRKFEILNSKFSMKSYQNWRWERKKNIFIEKCKTFKT